MLARANSVVFASNEATGRIDLHQPEYQRPRSKVSNRSSTSVGIDRGSTGRATERKAYWGSDLLK